MPHLDHSVRLDFKDVLIRPKRSTIRSRADVSTRKFFLNEYPLPHFHGKYYECSITAINFLNHLHVLIFFWSSTKSLSPIGVSIIILVERHTRYKASRTDKRNRSLPL